MLSQIKYGLWDARYRHDPDRAFCFVMHDTLDECKRDVKDEIYGSDAVIVKHYINERNVITKSEIVN